MPETKAILTAQRVHEIFIACLFQDGEDTANLIKAEGVTMNVGFHPGRIEAHKVEIGTMLAELPDEFKAGGGGGWSFLNACLDKHGNHWAEHQTIEKLLLLGLATGQAEYQMPRHLWAIMPGGMPYFVVK